MDVLDKMDLEEMLSLNVLLIILILTQAATAAAHAVEASKDTNHDLMSNLSEFLVRFR